MIYGGNVHLLVANMNVKMKNTELLTDATDEVGLRVNAGKTTFMNVSSANCITES
jgi:hypothetical protein